MTSRWVSRRLGEPFDDGAHVARRKRGELRHVPPMLQLPTVFEGRTAALAPRRAPDGIGLRTVRQEAVVRHEPQLLAPPHQAPLEPEHPARPRARERHRRSGSTSAPRASARAASPSPRAPTYSAARSPRRSVAPPDVGQRLAAKASARSGPPRRHPSRIGSRSPARWKAARSRGRVTVGEHELVVLPAAQRLVERRAVGDGNDVEHRTHVRGADEPPQVAREPVGDVDHRRRAGARRPARPPPAATVGGGGAARRGRRAAPRRGGAGVRAAAPPSAPVTKTASPGAAPARATEPPGPSTPTAVTTAVAVADRDRSPPSTSQPAVAAASTTPRSTSTTSTSPGAQSADEDAERARTHRGEVAQRGDRRAVAEVDDGERRRGRGGRPRRPRRCRRRAALRVGRARRRRRPRRARRAPPIAPPGALAIRSKSDILTPDPTPTGGGGWVRRGHGTCLP